MKNLLNKIYLQVGEDVDEDTDFNDLTEVTWSAHRIYDTDIVYILTSPIEIEGKTFYYNEEIAKLIAADKE